MTRHNTKKQKTVIHNQEAEKWIESNLEMGQFLDVQVEDLK